MAYLAEHLETADEWRKRKIKWAVDDLCNEGVVVTLAKVLTKSSISKEMFSPLKEYAQFCIEKAIRTE